ncbi:hypothetical protein FRC03_002238 [Tulasnella sp. 419]|nr:hypothetical protein FRC03_002238 [Tulasnella sp. 419]
MEQLWLTSSFGPSNGESRSSTDHGSNKTALIGAAASTTDLQPNQAPSPISGFPVTSGDRLPPDPKMTNKQLLMSIQRYHRGSPKCHNRFIWKRDGRRHHAFPPQVVPYPIAVDREASNLDVIDNLFFDGFCGTASLFHSGMLPIPRRVLDIGW